MKSLRNFDAQIFVPVEINRGQDRLCINRRQLLSVTYFREMRDGEHEPIYKLVEQVYLNFKPFVSNFVLQVCLAKADGHIEINDFMNVEEQQIISPRKVELIKTITPEPINQDLIKRITYVPIKEDYAIEAVPLSYRLTDAPQPVVITSTMQNSKRWTAPRPYIRKEKKKASIGEKVAHLEKVSWLQNWIVQPRQRKNGKYDMYYYHRRLRIMCRSLVEVHNFDATGTLPKRGSRKPKKDEPSSATVNNVNNKPAEPTIIINTPKKKRAFECAFGASTSSHPTENSTCNNDAEDVNNNDDDEDDNLIVVVDNDDVVVDVDDDDDDDQEAPLQSAEEFLKEAYKNLLVGNWNSSFIATDYGEINVDYEDSNDDDDEPPKFVDEFLKDSYKNLLNSTSSTTKSKASKGCKRRTVDQKGSKQRVGNCMATGSITSAKAKDHAVFDVPIQFKPSS